MNNDPHDIAYIGKHISNVNVASRSLTYKAYANQNVCNGIYPFKALKANLGSFKFGPHKRMHAHAKYRHHSASIICLVSGIQFNLYGYNLLQILDIFTL